MLKNFIKRIAAFAIVALVVSVVAIPAFAEARVTWRNGIVYYDYWFYGGTTQYNEVKQGYINNYGQMTPGSATYIGYSGTKKRNSRRMGEIPDIHRNTFIYFVTIFKNYAFFQIDEAKRVSVECNSI